MSRTVCAGRSALVMACWLLPILAALASRADVAAAQTTLLQSPAAAAGTGADDSGHTCMHDLLMENQLRNEAVVATHAAGVYHTVATYEKPPAATDTKVNSWYEEVPHAGVLRSASAVPLSGTDSAFADEEVPSARHWAPIRIRAFTNDLFLEHKVCLEANGTRPDFMGGTRACTAGDVLTAAKRDILLTYLLPRALDMHRKRLSVQPLRSLSLGASMKYNAGTNPYCSSFSSGAVAGTNNGTVTGADFVLFVAAGPIDPQYEAWAITCGYIASGRPTVGVINISPRMITQSDRAVRTVAHEILHALGFSYSTFRKQGITSVTRHVRGKPAVSVVASRNVLQRAGNQFGCIYMVGMELDDTAGLSNPSSHWLARNARDDLMSPITGPAMKYSAITMAAMEDLGFYKPNYDNAEYMDWGFQAGCGVLTSKCVAQERALDPDMFCDTAEESRCTADHASVGTCVINRYDSELPPYYQYFSDPTTGGSKSVEYCPVVLSYANGGCSTGDASAMVGSVVSTTSRCLNRAAESALQLPICAEVACDLSSMTYRVRFLDSEQWVDCPTNAVIDAHNTSNVSFVPGSTVVCPKYEAVCPATFNYMGFQVNLVTDGDLSDAASPSTSTLLVPLPLLFMSVLVVLLSLF